MKKILILANNAEGLYNFRFELIEHLVSKGFEVYFSLPEQVADLNVQSIINTGAKFIHTEINRRGINPFEDIKLIKSYIKLINNLDPDLILTYTIKPNIYGSFAARRFKKPLLMNITGLGTSLTNSKMKYLVSNLYRFACNNAVNIFFQNESNYAFFITKKLTESNKSILVPGSGVNTSKFIPYDKAKIDNVIRFIFIGRVMKEKGIEEYLTAARNVSEKYTNVEFQILGSFEEEKYKEDIIHNKNSRIKYLGTSNDVRQEIKNIDCIVNPSYHEGMSNVLLEGASMGKPLIASNIPGCKETIEEGYNGYLFEVKSVISLEEKLIRFIELNNNKKKIMGENSRNKIKAEFDRSIVIDEYMRVINKVLNI
jgi:glycosyltransferase involved in cell wall biosynthesis